MDASGVENAGEQDWWDRILYKRIEKGAAFYRTDEHERNVSFDSKPPGEKLMRCLTAITTRKLNGRRWYADGDYLDNIISYIMINDLWKLWWHEDKEGFLVEVRDRVFGKLSIQEHFPEKKDEKKEIFYYSAYLSNRKDVENRWALFMNWGMTLEMLCKVESEFGVPLPVRISEVDYDDDDSPWKKRKFVAKLAELSSKNTDFEEVWPMIVQEAFVRESPRVKLKSSKRNYDHFNRKYFCTSVPGEKLWLEEEDVEKVLEMYCASSNDTSPSPDECQPGAFSDDQSRISSCEQIPSSPVQQKQEGSVISGTSSANTARTSVEVADGVPTNATQSSEGVDQPTVVDDQEDVRQDFAAISRSLKSTTSLLSEVAESVAEHSRRFVDIGAAYEELLTKYQSIKERVE